MHQKNRDFFQVLCFVTSKIGVSIYWSFIYNVLLPNDIITIMTEEYKESILGVLLSFMNVFQVLGGVLTALASDYLDLRFNLFPREIFNKNFIKHRVLPNSISDTTIGIKIANFCDYISKRSVWGRRKPYVILGIAALSILLLVRNLFVVKNGGWFFMICYSIFTVFGDFFFAMMDICFYALIPEAFSENQVGLVSGLVSFADLLGVGLGVGFFGWFFHAVPEIYILLIIFVLIVGFSLPLFFFREVPPKTIGKHHHDKNKNEELNESKKPLALTKVNLKEEKIQNQHNNYDEEGLNKQTNNNNISMSLEGPITINEEIENENEEDKDTSYASVETENEEIQPLKIDPEEIENGEISYGDLENNNNNNSHNNYGDNNENDNGAATTKQTIKRFLYSFKPRNIYEMMVDLFKEIWGKVKSRNFRMLFCVIFFMGFGISTVENFFLYYLRDVIGVNKYLIFGWQVTHQPEKAQSIVMGCMLLFCLISAVISGILSDKIGCRPLIIIDSFLFGILTILFVVFTEYTILIFMAMCLGVLIGMYMSSAFALVSKLLIGTDKTAIGFGIMALAMELPIIFSTQIIGLILQFGKFLYHEKIIPNKNIGFIMSFGLCALFDFSAFMITFFFINEKEIIREHKELLKIKKKNMEKAKKMRENVV